MRQFELTSKTGKIIFLAEEVQVRELSPAPQVSSEEGYKAAVLEGQEVLDEIGLPSAKGVKCEDPKCKSALGHRLRMLRDLYIANKGTLEEIAKKEASIRDGAEFREAVGKLLSGNKEH